MGLDLLRPFWWIPCLLVLGYSVTGKGNRTTATAATGMVVPPVRSPDERLADAKDYIRSTKKPAALISRPAAASTGASAADDVIPLLLAWQGKQPVRSANGELKRTLFAVESDPIAAWAARQRSEAQLRNDGWQGQGVTLAQASVRQAGSFSCELRYGGECPPPPPPPPVAPRFSYELVGVFTSRAIKQAAFIDPATRTIVMAKQGEKIGDTVFRVRKFNLTSVEVGADGFTDNEKIPMSKKGDDPPGSTNP